jgi:hypothetical protein
LKESSKRLYDFDGKIIEPVGVITLPVSFGNPKKCKNRVHHLRCGKYALPT